MDATHGDDANHKDSHGINGLANVRFTIAVAWSIALAVSALPDILFHEFSGFVPDWLLWIKTAILFVFAFSGWFIPSLKPLRGFATVLMAIIWLGVGINVLWNSVSSRPFISGASFGISYLSFQAIEVSAAVIIVVLLFILKKRARNFYLCVGDIRAQAEPVAWLGQKKPGSLWSFGLVFTIVVLVGQFFMLLGGLALTPEKFAKFAVLIPVVVLLAALNGFSEEMIYRAAPISVLVESVGKNNAVWIAAVFFGLSHYLGGVPDGILGVVITGFIGWFLGKCLVDSKGFFWPWLFHAIQDVIPFAFLALASI